MHPRSYPRDLADRVRGSWPSDAAPLPAALDALLDTAYHASFLRDESRPVACRLIAVTADELAEDDGPPSGLLPLAFSAPRGFSESELRGLSPAAKYHRALIAIDAGSGARGDPPQIWGIVQTGTRWLQAAHGGHADAPPLPRVLVVHVVRPGHIAVACGAAMIAELRGGALTDFALDVFLSRWLPALFTAQRTEVAAAHRGAGGDPARDPVATELAQIVAQQLIKRVISTMRTAHHGGTLVIVPPECHAARVLHPKYAFADAAPRRRFRQLVLAILAEAARGDPRAALTGDLDEALFELSAVIASLAEVDGAVVLTKRFELLGFGAEIAGDLPQIAEVRRALDLEAEQFAAEVVDAVGTRHRSAYRLCAAVPGALAIVVSQDGSVRFASAHLGPVTYWEHGAGDQ